MSNTIDIVAMPNVGASKNGRTIFFDFAGHDGRTYKFQVTYEALPTIVESLINAASVTYDIRGDDPLLKGQRVPGSAIKATSFVTALSPDGSDVVLLFEAPGRQRVGVQLSPEQCIQLTAAAQDVAMKLAPSGPQKKPN